jgi:hypothetical protein
MERPRTPTRRLFAGARRHSQLYNFQPSARRAGPVNGVNQRRKRVNASNDRDDTCTVALQFTRVSLSYNKLYSHIIYLAAAVCIDHALPLPRRESDLPPTVFIFCASPTSSPMSLLYVSESCCSASLVWSRWVNSADVFCVCICSSDK